MSLQDGPIHLPPSDIPYQNATVNVETWIQSHLDGIHALLKWLDGYESAGKGQVPDYRILRRTLEQKQNENLSKPTVSGNQGALDENPIK